MSHHREDNADNVTHETDCGCGRHSGGRLLEAYLLLLVAEKPLHGYELALQLHSDFFLPTCAPDEATVYRNLRRLEEQGFLASSWDTEGGGPPRRRYEITPRGLETLRSRARDIEERRRRLTLFLERFKSIPYPPTGRGSEKEG